MLIVTMTGCSMCPECIQEDCQQVIKEKIESYENIINESKHETENLKAQIEKIEKFNKYYQKAKENHMYALISKADAEYMYELWSAYYNEQYYADSIAFCETARESYTESNSNHQSAIEYFKKAKDYADEQYTTLIEAYIKYSETSIEINWAMYEACEYFESASKYYSKGIKDIGDSEIDNANEKIMQHDNMIRELNEYAAKIDMMEEEI